MAKKTKTTKKKATAKKATKKATAKKATAKKATKKATAKKATKKATAKKAAKKATAKKATKKATAKKAVTTTGDSLDDLAIYALSAPDQPCDYNILEAASREALIAAVKEHLYVLHDGSAWIPQGPAFEEDDHWYQTMVKFN